MRYLFFFLTLCLLSVEGSAFAQNKSTPNALPDSLQLDSAYRARRAVLDQWMKQNQSKSPQEDFLSLGVSGGVYMKMKAPDLNEYFAERVYRTDPKGDRDQLSTLTNAVLVTAQAQLMKSFGIFLEYDYFNRTSNSTIDSNVTGLRGVEEEMGYTQHTISTGVMAFIYSNSFYRFRINAGIGGVFASVEENEGSLSRTATAKGMSWNIDLINDFRFDSWGSFTLDLLSRSASTATLKTANGETLDKPFGKRTKTLALAPTASNLSFGLAAGVVFYF